MKDNKRNSYIEVIMILKQQKSFTILPKERKSLHKLDNRAFLHKLPTPITFLFLLYIFYLTKIQFSSMRGTRDFLLMTPIQPLTAYLM